MVLRASQFAHAGTAASHPTGSPTLLPPFLEGSATLLQRGTMRRLRGRVGELEAELRQLERGFAALQGDKAGLAASLASRRAAAESAELRCEELQRLKFGRRLDVAQLDRAPVKHAGPTGEPAGAPRRGDDADAASSARLQLLSAAHVAATRELGAALAGVAVARVEAEALTALASERHQAAADYATLLTALTPGMAASGAPATTTATASLTGTAARGEGEGEGRARETAGVGASARGGGTAASASARHRITTEFARGVNNLLRHGHAVGGTKTPKVAVAAVVCPTGPTTTAREGMGCGGSRSPSGVSGETTRVGGLGAPSNRDLAGPQDKQQLELQRSLDSLRQSDREAAAQLGALRREILVMRRR